MYWLFAHPYVIWFKLNVLLGMQSCDATWFEPTTKARIESSHKCTGWPTIVWLFYSQHNTKSCLSLRCFYLTVKFVDLSFKDITTKSNITRSGKLSYIKRRIWQRTQGYFWIHCEIKHRVLWYWYWNQKLKL